MATFLPAQYIVEHLYKIVEEATEELVLISAYIKLDDETKSLLKNTRRGTPVHMLYGKKKSQLTSGDKSFLGTRGVKISFLKNLHAKCYLNQKEALVTSMNLLESSMENNVEMGILVSKQDEPVLYEAIYQDAKRLLRAANGESPVASSSSVKPKKVEIRTADNVGRRDFAAEGLLHSLRRSDRPSDAKVKPYC